MHYVIHTYLYGACREDVHTRVGFLYMVRTKIERAIQQRVFDLPTAKAVPELKGAGVWGQAQDGE